MALRLARITIFPIKSLDGMALQQVAVRAAAGLANDRRWAIVDTSGRFVTGKRNARVHRIRARFADDLASVSLALDGRDVSGANAAEDPQSRIGPKASVSDGDSRDTPTAEGGLRVNVTTDAPRAAAAGTPAAATAGALRWERFELHAANADLKEWLSAALGERVDLVENSATGFPDDESFNGPTVISTETLQTVASWFPGLSLDEVRRRFRANLEVAGAEVPFWEDRLYGPVGAVIPFRIGGVRFGGCNPCRRCVVPTRDPRSGRADAGFIERFRQMRAATLPPWAERSRFDHHYRLAVNTIVLDVGSTGAIAVGDPVALEAATPR